MNQAKSVFDEIFKSFEKQPDVMTGLLNIIELLDGAGETNIEKSIAVKRAAIAMALKTRGLKGRT